jgi:hypothetical protein
MPKPPIPLLDFQPDADHLTPGILLDCNNLVGTAKGLRPIQAFTQVSSTTLARRSVGFYTATLVSGQTVTIAILDLAGVVAHPGPSINRYDPVTKTFSTDNTEDDPKSPYRSRFATFGNTILMANSKEPRISISGTPFVTISSANPDPALALEPEFEASLVCVVDEGIFLIRSLSDEWRFSINPFEWQPTPGKLIAASPIPGVIGPSGPITAAARCRDGVVFFKETSMFLGRFTGPPYYYVFKCISETVGVLHPEAIINTGDILLFWGPDDFWAFDGSSLNRVPNNLKEWFIKRLRSFSASPVIGVGYPYPSVLGRWDNMRSLAVWHYTSVDLPPTSTYMDEWVALNIRTGKWTKGKQDVFDICLPSIPWYENQIHTEDCPALLDMTKTLCVQLKTNAAATSSLLTGELGNGTDFFQLNGIRPIFAKWPENDFAHLQAYKRTVNGYPIPDPKPVLAVNGVGPQSWLSSDGSFNLIQTSRSHQFQLDFTGDMEITSLLLDFIEAGDQ